jgi:hypothetical protein
MDNQILNRVNSHIKVRKERTEAFAIILIVLLNDRRSLAMAAFGNTSVLSNDP